MTADPLEKIREGLLTGVAAEPRRSRRRRMVASLAAVAMIFAGGGLVLASPWDDAADDAVVAGEGTDAADPPGNTDNPERSLGAGESAWAVEEPSGWHRAGRELMPNLGWDSLTLATVPLRPGGQRCAQMPEQALRDLSDDDALISIFFDVPPSEDSGPTGFTRSDLEVLENSDAAECAERDDLEVHWGHRGRAGVSFYILVVFGADVPEDVRERTWETLESFRPLRVTYPTSARPCTVTLPPTEQPDLPLPVAANLVEDAIGPGQSWVGTPDLWTALPNLGSHVPRKSMWWSQHFPGGSTEPRPPLRVTWERLDAEVPPIVAEAPGTNGPSPDSGFFMLNGIDPDEPGCWKVTAEYKGHELSYVYWNPTGRHTEDEGDDPVANDRQQAVGDGLMPELVGQDLNTLGDAEGVLFELQDILGQQTTRNVANDAPEGTVIAQTPAPGTPLDQVEEWELTVSAGGPVVAFEFLPPDVISFARGLPGMDVEEPLVERVTEFGTVYKTDRWLFGLDCDAVDAAYRTFSDARYDTTCPERFDGSAG